MMNHDFEVPPPAPAVPDPATAPHCLHMTCTQAACDPPFRPPFQRIMCVKASPAASLCKIETAELQNCAGGSSAELPALLLCI